MSSCTVQVTGHLSYLTTSFYPPLQLTEGKEWEAALLDFTTYNSIPNVIEGINNEFHFSESNEKLDTTNTLSLETGSYEIEDINRLLQEKLGKDAITLQANNNLLRCEMISKYYIDFSKDKTIGRLLGFSNEVSLLEPNVRHYSNNPVNIIKVNMINITCNIVAGAFLNGSDSHILHSFYPAVSPGFKIVEQPHNLVYLPLNVSMISNIDFNILDQDGDPVDFRGEQITLKIHIRARE